MVTSVELHAGYVRFHEDGTTVDFQLRWLRQHCHLERHLGSEDPSALGIADIAIEEDVLRIRWRHERRTSRFPLRWLRDHARAAGRDGTPVPVDRALALIAEHGGAVVRAADPAAWLIELAASGLSRGASSRSRDAARGSLPE
jgi:hypothetical protein